MIVVASTQLDKQYAVGFLRQRGVDIPYSEDFNALMRVENGKTVGVVGYNGFNGNMCCIHDAGDGNWISREFLRQAFRYPFVQLELSYLLATVSSTNHRALKLNRHLGFEVIYTLPDGYSQGSDMVLMCMKKHQCRWIKGMVYERQAA